MRERAGVEVEVIPGEEEARLAYLAVHVRAWRSAAARSSCSTPAAAARSSRSGTGEQVDERFSLNVGAARFTERFGLDGAVSDETLSAGARARSPPTSRRSTAGPLPTPLVGMGGAVTNLTAVKHGLAEYDPAVVQGTVLDLAEIDRQIELYRTRTADSAARSSACSPSAPR